MHDSPQEVTIAYRWPDGAVIGRPLPAPAPLIGIDVTGGFATYNPACPGETPVLDVVDPEAGLLAVHSLFGEATAAVADQVMRDSASRPAPVRRTAAQRDLVRLAQVRWCQEYSPLPLDPDLLRCEELMLRGRLGELCEDGGEWAGALTGECGRIALARREHPEPIRRLLIESLEALTVWEGDVEGEGTSIPRPDIPVMPGPAADGQSVALMLVGIEGELYAGQDTVDWDDVPRGWTSSAELNVHWCLEVAPGQAAVRVMVDPPPPVRRYFPGTDRGDGRRLAFDVEVPGWPVPVLSSTLAQDPTGGWTGVGRANRHQAGLLRQAVDAGQLVSVRVRALRPRSFQDRPWAQASRWASRGIAWGRMAGCGVRGAAKESAAALARAMTLFAELGRDGEAEACRGLIDVSASSGDLLDLTVAEHWLASR